MDRLSTSSGQAVNKNMALKSNSQQVEESVKGAKVELQARRDGELETVLVAPLGTDTNGNFY